MAKEKLDKELNEVEGGYGTVDLFLLDKIMKNKTCPKCGGKLKAISNTNVTVTFKCEKCGYKFTA